MAPTANLDQKDKQFVAKVRKGRGWSWAAKGGYPLGRESVTDRCLWLPPGCSWSPVVSTLSASEHARGRP